MCRPTKYDPIVTPQLAKWMRRSGLTDAQIASELDIVDSTFKDWKGKFPEFSAALKQPKNFVDSLVEDSLLKRALGYTTKEIHIESEKTVILSVSGDETPAVIRKVKRIKKHVAPDVTAQIFWLKNRQKEAWREKAERDAGDAQPTNYLDALKATGAEVWAQEADEPGDGGETE